MPLETLFYIIIAGIAALLLALFQYWYKSKITSNLRYVLTALRVISIFSLLLLLINPKFESKTFYEEKPNLVVAVDNSESIRYLNQKENALANLEKIMTNETLNQQFNVIAYSFDKTLSNIDSLDFKASQTNIAEALTQIGDVYANDIAPIVLMSDGNQTLGKDYSYLSKRVKQPVYPLILGDSVIYADLRIKQLNVNRYAFYKNKFPVEIIANYKGYDSITTILNIWSGSLKLFSKTINFNATKNSEIITANLAANKVGVQTYRVELVPNSNEKNTVNNYKNFGVEVIDQKTNIALIADQLHPDLGMLKRTIESNEQRSVSIINPSDYISNNIDYQLLILYQPNNNFNSILDKVFNENLNALIITGTTTNWVGLNKAQNYFKQIVTNQSEDFQPNLNRNYGTFIIDNLNFEDYPPLQSEFGNIEFTVPNDVILFKSVNGISINQPMLSTFEAGAAKYALWSGEGIWRWRAQTYLDTEGFYSFDNFIGKLVQYLSSTKKRNRLNIDYKAFYNGNDDVIITAQYFNKNYEFDNSAALTIILNNKDTADKREIPLLLNNGNFTIDLSGIPSGKYSFTVKHNTESVAASGSFEILEYNVEQQFLNADLERLDQLAKKSDGKAYFFNTTDGLINNLLADSRYRTIQKSTKNILPLLDWKYLLGILALSLFSEWFIRKYNGLI